ncbi:MAG: 30S ribosomal protein S16 [Vicinamibacterales bacterium]|nr:30S ribosomal protein S16 [Acidobacteriota bacterium]
MLSIRLRRMGSARRPFFRVVVVEARTARDSSYLEELGTYDPRQKPARLEVNRERVQHWVSLGARPSDTLRTLLQRHVTRDLAAPAAVAAVPAQ